MALVVFAVACTSSTESTTTTNEPATETSAAPTTTTLDPALQLELPLDPEIRQGELDNGVAYYIAKNDSPGGRVELRLLVDAGSIQEDPDQAGMAHFLEHMMFNGTERFPRNDLIDVLEAFGPRFGPDINAHTSFDETVYELSLSTDEDLVMLGIEVLREWASRATVTETDVVEERGVVLDEWRLRAQGFGARVFDSLQQLILPGTSYEGHLPIGTDSSISGTTSAALLRYYRDWYRPERMAVVAVGDFDVDAMEARIVDAFADLTADGEAREWSDPTFNPPSEPRVASLVDSEAAAASVSVVWPVASTGPTSVGDYQSRVSLSLALQILADRLREDALITGSPLLTASAVDIQWARLLGVRGIDVGVRSDDAQAGLEKVLTEVERMKRFGITTAEFDRALAGYEALVNQIHSQQETVQDTQIVARISAHHLSGSHLMSPDQQFEVETGIVGRLTRDDLDTALLLLLDGAPVVLTVGPDDPGTVIPDKTAILAALEAMPDLTLERRLAPDGEALELMTPPPPSAIESQSVDPRFGFTTIELVNGATVYFWETQIATEGVFGLVEGFGGTSVAGVEEITEANLMVEMVSRSGVADLDAPALQRLLADKLVLVQPFVTETRQGLQANAAVSDVETMFQLIYLYMTQPRFDPAVVTAVLNEFATVIASKDDLPDVLFSETLNHGYYGDDPRYMLLPTQSQLDEFDVDLAERLFRERYANANDFAFAFVGDFETDDMIDLAARYIGALPGTSSISGYVDNQPLPPRRVQVTTIESGIGQQGQLGMFFTNPFEPVLKDRVVARLTELIMNARLRDRIREQLGTTYSISATIDLQRDPDAFAEASIASTGDPAGLELISEEILLDISDLQANGPEASEFLTGVEQLRDELELIDNRTLADGLVTAHLYPDEPVVQLAERFPMLGELAPEDVQNMVKTAFNPAQRIEVRQVPLS